MSQPVANFEGHQPRACGGHRTVGPHRAWCFDCAEWCYPGDPCHGCQRTAPLPTRDEVLKVAEAASGQQAGDEFVWYVPRLVPAAVVEALHDAGMLTWREEL